MKAEIERLMAELARVKEELERLKDENTELRADMDWLDRGSFPYAESMGKPIEYGIDFTWTEGSTLRAAIRAARKVGADAISATTTANTAAIEDAE